MPTKRLLALAKEMIALIDQIDAPGGSKGVADVRKNDTADGSNKVRDDIVSWGEMAKQFYQCRRTRDKIFGAQMFGEPAWDIILDLFISECEGRRISVTSACIASCVPKATALRIIKQLEKTDIIVRQRDPDDARRSYVRLSPSALHSVTLIFHTSTAFANDGALVRANLDALLDRSSTRAA